MAERLGVSKTTVSAWELDKTMPELAKLPMIRDMVKVSLDSLICGSPSPAPPPGLAEVSGRYVTESQQILASILDELRALDVKQLRGLLGFLRASHPSA